MKKLFKIYAVILIMLGALAMFACELNVFTPPRDKMSAALNALNECYAVDMSMAIKAYAGDEKAEINMHFKIIDTEQAQTGYICLDNGGGGHTSSLYFSQGIVCEDSGYGYSVYQLELEDFIVDNDVLPASVDIDKLAGDSVVKRTKDGKLDKYTLTADKAAFGEIFGEFLGIDDFNGSLVLSVWLERSSEKLVKMEYDLGFSVDGTSCKVEMTIDINAVNDDVNIKFPAGVTEEIEKYRSKSRVILIAQPSYAGWVYGANSYSEGSDVSVQACPYSGYTFEGWYQGDVKISDNFYYSFNMPSENVTLTARFKEEKPAVVQVRASGN